MDLDCGPQAGMERVSILVLEEGGGPGVGDSFWAAAGASRQVDDRSCGEEAMRGAECFAGGRWRPCRGGVELVFAEVPEFGLSELTVIYRVRRECLVADDASLPDGLVQEYSRCSTAEAAVSVPQATIGDIVGEPDSSSADLARNTGEGPARRSGVLPAGIIEEGASSEDEDFSDIGDDCIITARPRVTAQQVKDNNRNQLVEEEESYPEDFELDDGDEEEDDS